jgi:hypothetical protein
VCYAIDVIEPKIYLKIGFTNNEIDLRKLTPSIKCKKKWSNNLAALRLFPVVHSTRNTDIDIEYDKY